MKSKRIKIILILAALLPFVLIAVYISFFYNEQANQLQISNIFDCLIGYFSIYVTILLAIIVYDQTEKINKLEIMEYDYYVGVLNIDNSLDLGELFFESKEQSSISYNIINNISVPILNLNTLNSSIKKGNHRIVTIPITMITKNKLLICGIKFNEVRIKTINEKEEHNDYRIILADEDNTIKMCFENNSKFPLLLGLTLNNESIHRIIINLKLDIINQYDESKPLEIDVSLLYYENSFYLESTKSIKPKTHA